MNMTREFKKEDIVKQESTGPLQKSKERNETATTGRLVKIEKEEDAQGEIVEEAQTGDRKDTEVEKENGGEESKIEDKADKVIKEDKTDKVDKDANGPDTIESLSEETQETIRNVLTKLQSEGSAEGDLKEQKVQEDDIQEGQHDKVDDPNVTELDHMQQT